jgi:hypothetical protein
MSTTTTLFHWYTFFRPVRSCFPLDMTRHWCSAECFFLRVQQHYVCLFSGNTHVCADKECHDLRDECVRCLVTGRIVDRINLDPRGDRHFTDKDTGRDEDESDRIPMYDTFQTSRTVESECKDDDQLKPFEHTRTATKRLLQSERGVDEDDSATLKDEEKKALMRVKSHCIAECQRQRVGAVWSELCDQFVVSDRVRANKEAWRRAFIALWDVYSLARAANEGTFSKIEPHDFVVAVVRGILHNRPLELAGGKIRLGVLSPVQDIRMPDDFTLQLSKSSMRLPVSMPQFHEPQHDAQVAERLRRLRLREEEEWDAQVKKFSSVRAIPIKLKMLHATSAKIRRAIERMAALQSAMLAPFLSALCVQ